MGKQLGAIEEGKFADIIVAGGDAARGGPLEAKTQVRDLFIAGRSGPKGKLADLR